MTRLVAYDIISLIQPGFVKSIGNNFFHSFSDGQLVSSVSSSRDTDTLSECASSDPGVHSPITPKNQKRIPRSPDALLEYVREQTIPCPEKDWEEYRKYLRWLHPRVASVTKWTQFSKVFLVSALEADGTNDIKEYLKEIAMPGECLSLIKLWRSGQYY